MIEPKEYKPTFVDRHGPDSGYIIRSAAYGIMTFLLTFFAVTTELGFTWIGTIASLAGGALASYGSIWFGSAAGNALKRFTMGSDTTPYVEQYSYQQALVMQGRIDDALESFEAVIAEKPDAIDPRVKAAELYSREKKDFARAAELFKEAQRIPAITTGQAVYVTNRLVDLYTGPLNDPGKALAELRRLIDKYPGSAAAETARDALAALKRRHLPS
jgi:tetratricopeptide (TPR) repeat protein